MASYGLFSLLPVIVVLAVAIWVKKPFEALLAGVATGVLIYSHSSINSVLTELMALLQGTLRTPTVGRVILICGLLGSFINVMVKSGSTSVFTDNIEKIVKTKKMAILTTWFAGVLITVDDYLSAISVGISMKRITDKFKISREMLAYIVDTTSAPVCVLVPLSTWTIFTVSLLEHYRVASVGTGMMYYIGIIPFIFYAWISVLIIPLIAFKFFPLFKKLKIAEEKAQNKTGVASESADKMDEFIENISDNLKKNHNMLNFIVPMITLVGSSFMFNGDVLKAVLLSIVVSGIIYIPQKFFGIYDYFETLFKGFESMLYPLAIIFMSFVLNEVNGKIGLNTYIIENIKNIMNPNILPALVFLVLSVITFTSGSFWGIMAISFPIVLPMANLLGADIHLTIGAIVSAAAFGSHACIFGDSTVLAAKSSGCEVSAHAFSQLPYTLVAVAVSTVLYLIFGFIL